MTETSDPFAVPRGARPPGSGSEPEQGKTTQVAQSAKESGAEVAHTAAEQVRAVTAEAGHELRDLVDQARTQLREQAGNQQQKVVDGLRSLVDELREMAEKSDQSGPATQVVRQSSHVVAHAADWLDRRAAGDLVDEVRKLGRRKPGAFLAGAALAGVLAGRLTRGVTDANSGNGNSNGHRREPNGNEYPDALGDRRFAAEQTSPIPTVQPEIATTAPPRYEQPVRRPGVAP